MRFLATTILIVITAPALADDPALTASDYVTRGMERFRANQIQASIKDFQQATQLEPRVEPHLWQLGISYYYAEKFKAGREQFEIHQLVNRNDVENAAWHFLCVARLEGVEAARKKLLEIDTTRDVRVPMREVYQLYAGQGTAKEVLAAAEKSNTELARMYAHLYLGLYFEVAKQPKLARRHLLQSAAAKLQQNYMHDVAKVHLLRRKWDSEPQIAVPSARKTPDPPSR